MNPIKLMRRLKHQFMHTVDTDWLKDRGLTLGERVYLAPEIIIDSHHAWLIEIGDDCVLAPRVHILAHDASTKTHLGYTKIARVTIGKRVFIGAASIVMPGVSIGNDVIIGAGSVVTKDIPSGVVAVGNPVRVICTLAEYLEKNRIKLQNRPCYPESGYTIRGGITKANKATMREELRDGIGFVD
jgi:maltose O-acetyltransferase